MKAKILTLAISVLLVACNFKKSEIAYAKKGWIDLRNSSIEYVSLKGEFAFAWQKVSSPAEMRNVKEFLPLPDEWNKYGYAPQGYATYSVRVLLPSQTSDLALSLPNIATAYRLFVNDVEIFKLGKFATKPDSSLAKYQKTLVRIPNSLLRSDTLQITFQVSNYEHFRGGIYNPIYLGKVNAAHRNTLFTRDFELFVLGALVFMMIFHFILFLFLSKRQNRESLFLAILCVLIIVRTLIISVGSQYWLVLFPDSSFELLIKLEFIAVYSVPLFMILFVNALIPNITSSKFLSKLIVLYGLLAFSALLPTKTYLYSLPIFYVLMLVAYGFALYTGIRGYHKETKDASLILIAFSLPFCFSIAETLHHQGIWHLEYANITFLGMILFFFIQSFVIAARVSKTFRKVAYLTKNLEKEVARRTLELETQKTELLLANEQIEKARESTMASIRYAQRIQNAILPSHRTISKHLKEYFIMYQPRDVVSGDFYWFQGGEEEFYIAVADCTGHGVPGAIMAVMADISLDYAFHKQEYPDIADLLVAFDRELIKLLNKNVNPDEEPAQDGLVIALCKVNKKTQLLTYTAANSPAFIVREGVLIELNPDKHIIGGSIKEGKEFSSQTFQLKEKDMLYLFSDGYQDQFGGDKKKKMGTRRFKEILLEIAPRAIEEQKEIIEKEFKLWKGNYSQIDDVLVIGIRF